MKQLPAITQTFILTSFSVLSLLAVPVQAASFMGLGSPSDTQNLSSDAYDVSADGSVVVGVYYGGSPEAGDWRVLPFRWTKADGMVTLEGFPEGTSLAFANSVSADGSVIVGNVVNSAIGAFRWTKADGIVSLGGNGSGAYGVSADGSVIVGGNGNGTAFRWTQETGMVDLGSLSAEAHSHAFGVSADGSVVVGYNGQFLEHRGFRWTELSGMVDLGSLVDDGYIIDFPLPPPYIIPNSVSADGSVIVGFSSGRAFRWTQETGMVGLLPSPNNGYDVGGNARDVSADGSIIVGYSGLGAFHWTQETGMVSLKETLIGKGLDVSGWTLYEADAISADGFTIVGRGINPSGQYEGWVANLSPEPVPEPLTILGSIAAIAFAAGFERKFNKNKSEEKDPDA
jgi:hypothetical protein